MQLRPSRPLSCRLALRPSPLPQPEKTIRAFCRPCFELFSKPAFLSSERFPRSPHLDTFRTNQDHDKNRKTHEEGQAMSSAAGFGKSVLPLDFEVLQSASRRGGLFRLRSKQTTRSERKREPAA